MVNNIWYYTRIYAVFVPRWLFLCVESAWANHTWPRWGEMFSELIPSVPRLQIYWSESPPHPPESALLHQFTVKLQSAPGAVWMSAQRPVLVFNEVIRTTQIPSIVYPGQCGFAVASLWLRHRQGSTAKYWFLASHVNTHLRIVPWSWLESWSCCFYSHFLVLFLKSWLDSLTAFGLLKHIVKPGCKST